MTKIDRPNVAAVTLNQVYAAAGLVTVQDRVLVGNQVTPLWVPGAGVQKVRFNRVHLSLVDNAGVLELALEPGFPDLPVESSTLHVLRADSCAGFTGTEAGFGQMSLAQCQYWAWLLNLDRTPAEEGQFARILPEFYVKEGIPGIPQVRMWDVASASWLDLTPLRGLFPMVAAAGRCTWPEGWVRQAELAVQMRWQFQEGIYVGSSSVMAPASEAAEVGLVDLQALHRLVQQGWQVASELCHYPRCAADRAGRLLNRFWQTPARVALETLVGMNLGQVTPPETASSVLLMECAG
jgi:hypothetical protein